AAPAERPPPRPRLGPRALPLSSPPTETRKNHRLAYHLWRRLAAALPALPPLVCVGGPGWRTGDLTQLIAGDPALRGKLLLLSGLTDRDLAWLYRHCAFTLYPSLVAGWGLPVVESLASGKYCVASSAPSIAELGGGLLDLLDPLDFAAWYREVHRLLTDAAYLRAREQRIAAYRPRAWAAAGD